MLTSPFMGAILDASLCCIGDLVDLMGIDHGRLNALMSGQISDSGDRRIVHDSVGDRGMSESVRHLGCFCDPSLFERCFHDCADGTQR